MKINESYSDERIIENSKKDSHYFSYIYRRYKERVFLFFSRRVNSKEEAWDLTQETFMRAFKSRQGFTYQGYRYSSYLFKVARNLLINYYRKKKTISLESLDKDPFFKPSYRQNFDNRLIWKATDDLLIIEKIVLEERYKKGKSIREIAQKVNKSENAVKLILSRARKKLRKNPIVKEIS
jgi:RNA polymerase sigma-70 factor (ECF subfamily)